MKTKMNKTFSITPSQFIDVDVNLMDDVEKWVRACKQEDFVEWALETKSLGLVPRDFTLNVDAITRLLREYLKMNISGWRIEPISYDEDEMLVRTELEEFKLKQGV